MAEDNENCVTCNGYVFVEALGNFIKTRSTVGLVCPDCGHDYGKDEK